MSPASSVSIVTELWDRGRGSISGRDKFFSATVIGPVLGPTQTPIQWVPRTLTSEMKRSGREADHSSSSSGGIKNAWRYISTPPYVFMVWCLIKYRISIQGVVPELRTGTAKCLFGTTVDF
jgi:hypothetical protein